MGAYEMLGSCMKVLNGGVVVYEYTILTGSTVQKLLVITYT